MPVEGVLNPNGCVLSPTLAGDLFILRKCFNISQKLVLSVPHPPCLCALFMIKSEHVEQSVDDKGNESFVERQTCLQGLFLRLFHRDDQVSEYLTLKTIQVGKRDHVGGSVFAEIFQVKGRNLFVIRQKDIEVSILLP